MSHSAGNIQISCLVGHGDGFGQCILCEKCGQFIRPQNFKEDCPADEEEFYYF